MEKLTLKEIAGYAHTDLKLTCPERYNFGGMITDLEEVTLKCAYEGWIMFKEVPGFYPIEHFKPILYSLEMLTKPIVHNGVEIILLNEMKKKFYNVEFNDFIEFDPFSINISLDSNSGIYWGLTFDEIYGIIQMFYEHHFDIHGLIERGLAIDKSKI